MFSRLTIFTIIFLYPVFVFADSNVIKDSQSEKFFGEKFFRDHDISLYGVSWTKHLIYSEPAKTERFENQLWMVGISIDEEKKTKFLLGTLKNSYNKNCALVGLSKDWVEINQHFNFVGMYGYVGELPGGFTHCGDDGIYRSFEKTLGVGFAPYIWHGIRYSPKSANYFAANVGIIFPGIIAAVLEFKF